MPQKIEQLDHVTLTLKANIYFDGGVVSHTVTDQAGARRTVGIIRPGNYHFNTDAPERMDLIAGACKVKLAGEKEWKAYREGQVFLVGAKSSFDITVDSGLTEYLCTFEPA
jgi:uncharacterized protein YaiE (UPF0345 family)